MIVTIREQAPHIARGGDFPLASCTIVITFRSPAATRDWDGLLTGAKPWIGGLKAAGMIVDDNVGRLPDIDLRWRRGASVSILTRPVSRVQREPPGHTACLAAGWYHSRVSIPQCC